MMPRGENRTSDSSVARMTGIVVLVLGVALGFDARAEFHTWHDAAGRKHVSTIPGRGFDARGRVVRRHDPNSVVYQHRRMLVRLGAREAELAARAAAERRAASNRDAVADTNTKTGPATRRVPREGLMNLDELIALEKRGGRWQGRVPDQGAQTTRSK